MGRHRSTLRELGWGASNSPNPWKQGSAKRVVRTLDYSNVDIEADAAAEAAMAPDPSGRGEPEHAWEDRLQALQQDGMPRRRRRPSALRPLRSCSTRRTHAHCL